MRALLALVASALGAFAELPPLRAPAVPLIVQDPLMSFWSAADGLNSAKVSHWTGQEIGMTGMILVQHGGNNEIACLQFMGVQAPGCNSTGFSLVSDL